MSSSIVETGGLCRAITPEEWAAYVLDHPSHASVPLAYGATEIRTDSRVVHIQRITADAADNWYDEYEPIAEDGPARDDRVLTPQKVATIGKFSNESVNDSRP